MRVVRVGLTPLKGTRHQAQDAVELSATGPVDDRAFCLVDPGSGQVLKTVANGSLLAAAVAWQHGVLTVELAGQVVTGQPVRTGEIVASYWGRRIRVSVVGGPWAEAFSRYLGRPVLLGWAKPRGVVYDGAVSVVTTTSLTDLHAARRHGTGRLERLDPERDSARFRSTFVVDTTGSPYAEPGREQSWIGHELVLGAARVRLTGPVVRCGVVDLDPVSGHRDLRLLDALPRGAGQQPVFGVQGEVVQLGLVRQDSPVSLIGGSHPAA